MLAKALQAHHRVIGVHHVLLESRHRAVIAVRTEQQIPVQAMPFRRQIRRCPISARAERRGDCRQPRLCEHCLFATNNSWKLAGNVCCAILGRTVGSINVGRTEWKCFELDLTRQRLVCEKGWL